MYKFFISTSLIFNNRWQIFSNQIWARFLCGLTSGKSCGPFLAAQRALSLVCSHASKHTVGAFIFQGGKINGRAELVAAGAQINKRCTFARWRLEGREGRASLNYSGTVNFVHRVPPLLPPPWGWIIVSIQQRADYVMTLTSMPPARPLALHSRRSLSLSHFKSTQPPLQAARSKLISAQMHFYQLQICQFGDWVSRVRNWFYQKTEVFY